MGVARPPPFTLFTITYKVAERTDTHALFRLYPVVKSMKNNCPRICGGYYSRCSDHPARRGVDLLLWETRSQASMLNSCVADPDPGSGAFLNLGSGSRDPGWIKKSGSSPDHISESLETIFGG